MAGWAHATYTCMYILIACSLPASLRSLTMVHLRFLASHHLSHDPSAVWSRPSSLSPLSRIQTISEMTTANVCFNRIPLKAVRWKYPNAAAIAPSSFSQRPTNTSIKIPLATTFYPRLPAPAASFRSKWRMAAVASIDRIEYTDRGHGLLPRSYTSKEAIVLLWNFKQKSVKSGDLGYRPRIC